MMEATVIESRTMEDCFRVIDTAEILGYGHQSSVYTNPNLVLRTDDKGQAWVTQESVREFIRLHGVKKNRWVRRKNSLPDEDIDKIIEKPRRPSKITRRFLQLYREGYCKHDIASMMDCTEATVRHHLQSHGVYSTKKVREQFPNLDAIKSRQIPHVRSYPKDEVRLRMLETIVSTWKGDNFRYLGLEGPHFCSYIDIALLAGDELEDALFVEQDERSYHIMDSLITNRKVIEGGQVFDKAHVRFGTLRDVLTASRKGRLSFNLFNLDYEGSVCAEKIDTFRLLFKKKVIDDYAVMVVTLNNSSYMGERVRRGHPTLGREFVDGFKTNDQEQIVFDELSRLGSEYSFGIARVRCEEYKCRKREMITFVYELRRKK